MHPILESFTRNRRIASQSGDAIHQGICSVLGSNLRTPNTEKRTRKKGVFLKGYYNVDYIFCCREGVLPADWSTQQLDYGLKRVKIWGAFPPAMIPTTYYPLRTTNLILDRRFGSCFKHKAQGIEYSRIQHSTRQGTKLIGCSVVLR